jgi:hypothetical protein
MINIVLSYIWNFFALFGIGMSILIVWALVSDRKERRKPKSKEGEFIMVSNVPNIISRLEKEGIEVIGSFYEDDLHHIIFDESQDEKVNEFVSSIGDNKYV